MMITSFFLCRYPTAIFLQLVTVKKAALDACPPRGRQSGPPRGRVQLKDSRRKKNVVARHKKLCRPTLTVNSSIVEVSGSLKTTTCSLSISNRRSRPGESPNDRTSMPSPGPSNSPSLPLTSLAMWRNSKSTDRDASEQSQPHFNRSEGILNIRATIPRPDFSFELPVGKGRQC